MDSSLQAKQLQEIKDATKVLRSLNHKVRQNILNILREKVKTTVSELYTHMKIEQSVASQHLGILRSAGVVNTQRDGKFVYYSVNEHRINRIHSHCAAINNER